MIHILDAAYFEGKEAYLQKTLVSDCPYRDGEFVSWWTVGWWVAYNEATPEAEENGNVW